MLRQPPTAVSLPMQFHRYDHGGALALKHAVIDRSRRMAGLAAEVPDVRQEAQGALCKMAGHGERVSEKNKMRQSLLHKFVTK